MALRCLFLIPLSIYTPPNAGQRFLESRYPRSPFATTVGSLWQALQYLLFNSTCLRARKKPQEPIKIDCSLSSESPNTIPGGITMFSPALTTSGDATPSGILNQRDYPPNTISIRQNEFWSARLSTLDGDRFRDRSRDFEGKML